MKAITCSQCGALIKGISSKGQFVDCTYCGAEIPIKLEKIFEISAGAKIDSPEPVKFTKADKENLLRGFEDDSIPFLDEETATGLKVVVFIAALVLLVVIPTILVGFFSNRSDEAETPIIRAVKDSSVYPTSDRDLEPETPTPTPFPDFSYRAYVKYFTNIGVEDAVVPVIEGDQLPTLDLAVLKKTVFKEKRIKVRITINPDGEVIDAKPLNGHPVLQEFCVIAAKKSLFTTRKQNYSTTLTYIFVIEN